MCVCQDMIYCIVVTLSLEVLITDAGVQMSAIKISDLYVTSFYSEGSIKKKQLIIPFMLSANKKRGIKSIVLLFIEQLRFVNILTS